MSFVGIDGCKSGWIAVVLRDGLRPDVQHLRRIDDVAAAVPDAEVIGIDIPIGLPESGRRAADIAAKQFLGPRRQASVFFTPMRAVVEAMTWAEANVVSMTAAGVGISRQSHALAPKILEVERWLTAAPCPVYEVHPEVSFAVLLEQPATASKKTWAGMVERRRALTGAGIDLDDVPDGAASVAAVDDVLDAAVVAWTARRIAAGVAVSLPAPPEPGAIPTGMAIWC